MEKNGTNSFISIVSYEIKEVLPVSYVLYSLKGSLIKDVIYRRYSDFDYFRNALRLRWPGVFLPGIPDKKKVGNLNKPFIRLRKKLLNHFLNRLTVMSNIVSSVEIKRFAVADDSWKSLIESSKVDYSEIAQRYLSLYPEFKIEEFDSAEIEKNLLYYKRLIGEAQKRLNCLCDQLENKVIFDDDEPSYTYNVFGMFNSVANLLYSQGNIIDEADMKSIFKAETHFKNPFEEYYISVMGQFIDINGFNESFDSIDNLKKKRNQCQEKVNKANYGTTNNPAAAKDKEDIKNLNIIIAISLIDLEKNIKRFTTERISCHAVDMITLKDSFINKSQKIENSWSQALENYKSQTDKFTPKE